MMKLFAGLGAISLFAALPAAAQNMPSFTSESAPAAAMAAPSEDGPGLAGRWSYRSYLNTADQPIFGGGIFTFETPDDSTVTGTLDMGGGLVLDLEGRIVYPEPKGPLSFEIIGTGRANTPTDGWQYDYNGNLAHQWQNGVDQVPALVGSVIRAKPHNGAPAGVVASFIAVSVP
jgi:hypothetical protein